MKIGNNIMNMKKTYIYLSIILCVLFGYSCNDLNDFEQGTFQGKVIDAVSGEGLGDVGITLDPVVAANGSITTRPDGSFKLSRITAGTYKINVRVTGQSLIDNARDEITITDGVTISKEYKLTPRVSLYDFKVEYEKSDPTKFTVKFKAKGNEGNDLNFYAIMWDKYSDFKFGDLPNDQKKAFKKNVKAGEEVEITQELTGLNLEMNTTYYIRAGVTQIKNGGDYNHSNIIPIKFE